MPTDQHPDDTSLTVTTAEGGAWAIVSVRGEVDISTASSLEGAVRGCLASSGRVIIDLSGVRFMDSTGLNVLIRAQTSEPAERDSGGTVLRLAAVPDRVAKLLRLTQLDEVFAVYPSVTAAESAPVTG